MSVLESTQCCGIKEIANIAEDRNSKETVRQLYEEIYENDKNASFFIFSDICRKKYGKNLHKYIIKNHLGEVIKSKSQINPNSSNSLTMWIWTLNRKNLKKWSIKNHKKEQTTNSYEI